MISQFIIEQLMQPHIKPSAELAQLRMTMYHRYIQNGDCYIHLSDQRQTIDAAIELGATLIWAEGEQNQLHYYRDVPIIKRRHLKLDLPNLLQIIYPVQQPLGCIGITGTNGKTTTTYWIYQLLTALKYQTAYIGTLGICDSVEQQLRDTGYTTPDIAALQQYVVALQQKSIQHLAIEVSSHALQQNRVANLHFELAVFTNLSQDHLDYHHTIDNYFDCKSQLFLNNNLKKAIVNYDDSYGQKLIERIKADNPSCEVITFSTQSKHCDYYAAAIDNQRVTIVCNKQNYQLQLPNVVLTQYNIANLIAAMATAIALGAAAPQVLHAAATLQPPNGRMQSVTSCKDRQIIIDFAHSPEALALTLGELRQVTRGRLLTLIGCGGDRDKSKRPIMGSIACQYSDLVVFTSDNPRSELPEQILRDMTADLSHNNYSVIADRKSAIASILAKSQAKDTVLIAGRGSESHQKIGDSLIAFDDYQVTKDILENSYA